MSSIPQFVRGSTRWWIWPVKDTSSSLPKAIIAKALEQMSKQIKKAVKKRASTKKVTRRRRKTAAPDIQQGAVIDLEQFYKAVNRVQLSRETFVFVVKNDDAAVFENILKDLELPFQKKPNGDALSEYTVSPGKERPLQVDTDDVEEFPDEIAEDGQVFF